MKPGARFLVGLALCALVAASVHSAYLQISGSSDELAALHLTTGGIPSSSGSTSAAAASTDGSASGAPPTAAKKSDPLSSSPQSNSQPQLQAAVMPADANRGTAETTAAAGRIAQPPLPAGKFATGSAGTDSAAVTADPGSTMSEPSPDSNSGKDDKSKKVKRHVVRRKPARGNDTAQASNVPDGRVFAPQPVFGLWGNNVLASQRAYPPRPPTGWPF
jgi:hypothetical protein